MCISIRRTATTYTANRWSLVAAAGLIVFMAQLDATIVLVALPSIEDDLDASTAATQWVVLAYVVPLIALTLLSGRWVDVVGRRRALGVGSAGFALASGLAGLAPRMDLLIGARIGQGAMAALLLALAPVLAVEAVTPGAKGRALGVVSTLAPLGALSGPLLGGQLVDAGGWPWIFLVNLPVAIAVATLGRIQLPAEARWRAPHPAWLGEAALFAGAAIAFLLALTLTATHGVSGLLALLVVPAVLVAWRRTDTSRPVRRLVRADGMTGPHLALAAAYTALLLVQFLMPFYLTRTLGLSSASAGLVLMAYPAATVLVGTLSGVLTDRQGARSPAVAGVAILTAALVLLVPLDEGWQPLDVAWRLAAVGVGFGLFVTPVQTLAMTLSPPALLGVTAATTNLARQLGLALGPALATAAWAASGYALSGMRAALALAVAASAVALVAVRRGPVSMSINHQGDDDVTEDRRDLLLIDRQRARPGTGGR